MRPKFRSNNVNNRSKSGLNKKIVNNKASRAEKKSTAVLVNGSSSVKTIARKSKRLHTPVKKYELKTESPKNALKEKNTPAKYELIYEKGDHLAIRNDTGSFYLCTTLQNVYNTSSAFVIQWLNTSSSNNLYDIDYLDHADVATILTNVKLTKKSKSQYELSEGERKRITNALNKSVKAENGIAVTFSDEDAEEDESDDDGSGNERKKRTMKRKSSAIANTFNATAKLKKSTPSKRKLSQTKSDKQKLVKKVKSEKRRNAKFPKNLDIKVLETDPTFSSKPSIPPISIMADTKVTLKAVRTKDYALLKSSLANVKRIAYEYTNRSYHCKDSALLEAIINEDHKAFKMIYDQIDKKNVQRVKVPSHNVPLSNTGCMNIKMLGHATAPISAARGSREGNGALIKDNHFDIARQTVKLAMKRGVSYETLVLVASRKSHNQLLSDNLLYENICWAVQNGHVKLAKKLIDEVVKKDGYGFTNLFSLALTNSPNLSNVRASSVVKKTLGHRNLTPLHCAAINPNPQPLAKLLSIQPDYIITDEHLNQPIHYAAACVNEKTTDFLIKRGVSIDVFNKKRESPLHIACKLGHANTVEVLLDKASEQDQQLIQDMEKMDTSGSNKKTVFLRASQYITKKGYSPLHLAARRGHHEVIKTMLRYSINIDKKTSAGMECVTAFIYAAQQGHLSAVRALVEGGAKIELGDRRKKTALVHAVMNGQTHVVSYLLHEGADPNVTDSSGNTLVHYAAAYGWWYCLKLVIQAGANPAQVNLWKFPPVVIAMLKNHEGIVKYLLDLPGVDVDHRDDEGKTLLMHSMSTEPTDDNVNYIKFFIEEKEADASILDVNNNNCLHYLAMNKHKKQDIKVENFVTLANLLISNGCDMLQMNKNKMTPFLISILMPGTSLFDFYMKSGVLEKAIPQETEHGNFLHFLIATYEQNNSSFDDYLYKFREITKKILESKQNNQNILSQSMVNEHNEKGYTPLIQLFKAVEGSNFYPAPNAYPVQREILEILLKDFECDPNIQEQKPTACVTALHHAVCLSATHLVPLMIKYKADLDVYDKNGMTALHKAIKDQMEISHQLIKAGANVNLWTKFSIESDNYTPLLYASGMASKSENRQVDQCSEDQINGFEDEDNESGDNEGNESGDNESNESGDDDDENVDEEDNYEDAKENHDTNYKSVYVDSITSCTSNLDVLIALLDHGADIHQELPKNKRNILHLIASQNTSANEKLYDITRRVLNMGVDINKRDIDGSTPLHIAVSKHFGGTDSTSDFEELFLEYGADPHVKDAHGRIPLHYVFISLNGDRKGNVDPIEMTSILVQAMKDENVGVADNEGVTCMHYAACCGASVCCSFLSHKMDINTKDANGNTPIALAASECQECSTLMLLQSNADTEINIHKTKKGGKKDKKSEYLHPVFEREQADENIEIPFLQEILKHDWQGVLNMILMKIDEQNGNLYDAIESAIMEQKFNLVLKFIRRTRHPKKLLDKNKYKQSFLHRLALASYDSQDKYSQSHIQCKISEALINKGLSLTDKDQFNATPIIYAVQNHNLNLCKYFWKKLEKYDDRPDIVGRTLISSIFWLTEISLDASFQFWIKDVKNHVELNTLTSYPQLSDVLDFQHPLLKLNKNESVYPLEKFFNIPKVSPLIYCILDKDETGLVFILDLNPDLNFPCAAGRTPLMYAVIKNKMTTLKYILNKNHMTEYETYQCNVRKKIISKKQPEDLLMIQRMVPRKNHQELVDEMTEKDKHFNMVADVDFYRKDAEGKTVINHLIHHFELGTFDNLRMLQLLICIGFKASNEEWRRYISCADKVGAVKIAKFLRLFIGENPSNVTNSNFVVNDKIHWPHPNKYNYEVDARNAITAINPEYFEPDQTVRPNKNCTYAKNGVVVIDEEQDIPYSVKMHKLDINYGVHGFYNYYMMQVVYDHVQNLHVLYTHWGRIGHSHCGQWQNTPCTSKEEAVHEFSKIFNAKSGNKWKDFENFEMLPHKYHLVNTARQKEVSIKDIDVKLEMANMMPSKLPLHLKKLMQDFTDIKMLKSGWRQHRIDSNISPFGMLDSSQIEKAEKLIHEIMEINKKISGVEEEMNKAVEKSASTGEFIKKSYTLHREIEKLSEEVFSTLPLLDFTEENDDSLLEPLFEKDAIASLLDKIEELKEFDITSKLVLAAQNRIKEVHPMDYIYRALGCKLELLNPKSKTSSLIIQYILASTNSHEISAIYKLSRDREEENFQKLNMGNRKLLWHGTKLENIVSIFKQGLRVSPNTAEKTGQIFGKGIYFSDSFAFSESYCGDDGNSQKVIFLCEVALGKGKEKSFHRYRYNSVSVSEDNENSRSKVICDSVTVINHKKKQQNFTLTSPYGAAIPYLFKIKKQYDNNSEYIVPKKEQVCLRYMIVFR